jgi:hypothetical protein
MPFNGGHTKDVKTRQTGHGFGITIFFSWFLVGLKSNGQKAVEREIRSVVSDQ